MIRVVKIAILLLAAAGLLSVQAAEPPVDEREILLQLDRAFDRATADKGVEGWVACFAENGSLLPEAGPPITGPEAIREAMEPLLSDPENSLRWQPTRAEILIPGVLGYTVGRFQRRTRNPEGQKLLLEGSYCTIWRKQADGSWKIVLDTGSPMGRLSPRRHPPRFDGSCFVASPRIRNSG
jgi:ketosteroid isomerase-like protein